MKTPESQYLRTPKTLVHRAPPTQPKSRKILHQPEDSEVPMNRDEAHAAIVYILSDMPREYKFTDAADDILDNIWPDEPPMPTGDAFIDKYFDADLVSSEGGENRRESSCDYCDEAATTSAPAQDSAGM